MELEIVFQEAWNTASRAWPGVVVAKTTFVARLHACGLNRQSALDRGNDIYLALACAAGNAAAVKLFEQTFLRVAPRQLGRMTLTTDQQDELLQRLRVKVLVGPTARIRDYLGSGPLGAWVRVCAVRLALEMKAQRQDHKLSERKTLDAFVASTPNAESLLASRQHAGGLRQALQEAIAALSARDRTLLRLHYLDEMTIDVLGNIYGVHRATVARWLVAIRGDLLKRVRLDLAGQIGASPSEAQSLAQLMVREGRTSVATQVGRLLASDSPRSS